MVIYYSKHYHGHVKYGTCHAYISYTISILVLTTHLCYIKGLINGWTLLHGNSLNA